MLLRRDKEVLIRTEHSYHGRVNDRGVRIPIRVKPGASREYVGGSYGDTGALIVAVRERAIEGAATRAVLRALAHALGVKPADITLVSGGTGRSKVVEVTSTAPEVIDQRVQLLLTVQ